MLPAAAIRCSSVSEVSGYGLEDRGLILSGDKDLSVSLCVQNGSGTHWPSYAVANYHTLFSIEAVTRYFTIAQIKNTWSLTSTPAYFSLCTILDRRRQFCTWFSWHIFNFCNSCLVLILCRTLEIKFVPYLYHCSQRLSCVYRLW